MDDTGLAELVARDLKRHVEARLVDLDGPVYALSLWVENVYGVLGVNIATETSFRSLFGAPAYARLDRQSLYGPAGRRWCSGNWPVIVENFLSDETDTALEPMRVLVQEYEHDEADNLEVMRRWAQIGLHAFDLAGPLSMRNTVPEAITFVEFPDSTPVGNAEAMLWAVGAERLHRAIPDWRELARAVRAIQSDPERLSELREKVVSPREEIGFPARDEPARDELTAWLRACDLTWSDVTTTSPQLVRSLAIGEATCDDRGPGFEWGCSTTGTVSLTPWRQSPDG